MFVLSLVLLSSAFGYQIGDWAVWSGGRIVGVEVNGGVNLLAQFLSESAGYKSTIGYFTFTDPTDASTFGPDVVLWPNASALGSGGTLLPGDTKTIGTLPLGTKVGIYLIANGYNRKGRPIYRTTIAGGSDTLQHYNAVIDPAKLWIRFAWEDMVALGDKDYNDVIIKMMGAPMPVAGLTFGMTSLLSGAFMFMRKRRMMS